jgi:hypothetical protein
VDPAVWDSDREFTERWRDELLKCAWSALAAFQEQTGKPYHTVLRLRAEQVQLSSAQMAEELSARLGKPFTPAALRQLLHRSRTKFAELLLAEVAQSLQTSDPERVDQELIDLGLFRYCHPTSRSPAGDS